MSERITWAVQLRNPAFMRRYGSGTEFPDREIAVDVAKRSVGGGLRVRVVEIRRRITWTDRALRPSDGGEPENV